MIQLRHILSRKKFVPSESNLVEAVESNQTIHSPFLPSTPSSPPHHIAARCEPDLDPHGGRAHLIAASPPHLHRHLLLRPLPTALRAPPTPSPPLPPLPSSSLLLHHRGSLPRHGLLAPLRLAAPLRRCGGSGEGAGAAGGGGQAPPRYREAVGLQVEAFWRRNYLLLVGAGVIICIALWRVMFGIASTFVGLSEGMAKYGFLALATAMVAFAGMYARVRFTINPDKVYRIAMTKLNTSAAILEVMWVHLFIAGTDARAYVMVGGKWCFYLPIKGPERKGLVSVEVKKKKGQVFKIFLLLFTTVDIPMATGPDQRVIPCREHLIYRSTKVVGFDIRKAGTSYSEAMAAERSLFIILMRERGRAEDERRDCLERRRGRGGQAH
ncbi:hypothetical protein ZWY2020_020562 [Hordeum vulgare]|nr:hypothetical protein ZWY2020_020562 [Hordeum vulgare]